MEMCGVEDSDWGVNHALEMFSVERIEPGNPKKAPFVLRTNDQMECLERVNHAPCSYE